MRKIIVVLSLSVCINAEAREFQPIGFESIGMGGAGVASAQGSMAGYYNPALLTKSTYATELVLSAGAGVREYNLADNLDRLNKVDFTGSLVRVANNAPTILNPSPPPNSQADRNALTTSQTILSGMSGGKNGLSLMPSAAFGMQVKRFGAGIYGTSDATATAVVDGNHLALSVKNGSQYYNYNPATDIYSTTTQASYEASSLEYAVNNKLTYVRLNGLTLLEVPLSYGLPLDMPAGKLGIGASLKYMKSTTYNARIKVDTGSGNIDDQLNNIENTDSALGVDLGVLFTPADFNNLTLGLVGKNLNSPSFETVVAGETYKVAPQFRAGLDVALNPQLNLALDLDLTSNKTFITDLDTRYLGGGFNYRPASWFSLRMGAMQNLESSNEGVVLTGGLGFGFKWFQVDVATQVSNKKGYLDGEEVPRYARANIALVSRW